MKYTKEGINKKVDDINKMNLGFTSRKPTEEEVDLMNQFNELNEKSKCSNQDEISEALQLIFMKLELGRSTQWH